jgi:hypothetical protein
MVSRSVFWLFVLVFCSSGAQAVCFKDGVSVDPSKSGPVISWNAEFRQATAVVIATVLSAENVSDQKDPAFWSGTLYRVKIEALLKGNPRNSIDVFSANDSGRLLLATGTRYILFLEKHGEHLTANACGNSARLGLFRPQL